MNRAAQGATAGLPKAVWEFAAQFPLEETFPNADPYGHAQSAFGNASYRGARSDQVRRLRRSVGVAEQQEDLLLVRVLS